MQQALELALTYISDIRTLVACSLVNQQCRQSTQDAVTLNLPSLIQQCKGIEDDDSKLQHLQWLCSTAGPAAVNTHEAGCAILQLLADVSWYNCTPQPAAVLNSAGLVITNGLLTRAVSNSCPEVLQDILQHCDLGCVDHVYTLVASVHSQINLAHSIAALWPQIAAALPTVTAAQMADLLRMASRRSSVCLALLLGHDRDHVHLLHNSRPGGGHAPAGAATCGHDNSTAGQQQQPGAVQLMMELLEHAVKEESAEVVDILCDVDVATQLGTLPITRLLYLAAFYPEGGIELDHPCVMASLARLPGARAVSADCIATILHQGIEHKCWHHSAPLLQLPAGKLISSHRLCNLLLTAARENTMELFGKLCRLADGRQLDSKPMVKLMEAFVQNPDLLDHEGDPVFGDVAHMLDGLASGRHLGGDGILDLLEFCTKHERHGEMTEICRFEPAAAQITDLARFTAVLRGCSVGDFTDMVQRLWSTAARPVLLQLQSAHWVEILQAGADLDEELLSLPAVQQISAEQLGKLLQELASEGELPRNTLLLRLPAAQQLAPAVVGTVLLQLLQTPRPLGGLRLDVVAWEGLLLLEPAQQMDDAVLQQLLDTAWELGYAKAARTIQQRLPKAASLQCTLSSEQLARSVVAASKRDGGWGDALLLVQQPGMQGLSADGIVSILHELLRVPKKESVGTYESFGDLVGMSDSDSEEGVAADTHAYEPAWVTVLWALQALPALQQLGASDIARLIAAYVAKYGAAGLPSDTCSLSIFTGLAAAVGLTAEQLVLLLQDMRQRVGMGTVWPAWGQLCMLPGVQQLSPAQLACSLKLGLGSHLCSMANNKLLLLDNNFAGHALGLPLVLSQHPAGVHLTPEHIEDVVRGIMWSLVPESSACVEVLLGHAAGQQLSTAAVVGLVRDVVEHSCLMQLFLKLPAASGIDADAVHQLQYAGASSTSQPAAAAAAAGGYYQAVLRDLCEAALRFHLQVQGTAEGALIYVPGAFDALEAAVPAEGLVCMERRGGVRGCCMCGRPGVLSSSNSGVGGLSVWVPAYAVNVVPN